MTYPLRTLSTAALVAVLALGGACVTVGGVVDSGPPLPRRVPSHHSGSFTTWWADQIPKEEGSYLDGQRHGRVQGYHPDGTVAFDGDFEQGVPVGTFRTRLRTGVTTVARIADGKRNGPCQVTYADGVVAVENHYRDGLLDGHEITRHANGRPKAEGDFERGRRVGPWRSWDASGRLLMEEQTWWGPNGEQVGRMETVYAPGGQTSSQTLTVLRNGSWLGWMTLWHPNGVQAGLVEIVDEARQGRDLTWDANGTPRVKGQRAGDRRVGAWVFFDAAGSIERTVEYGDGSEVAVGG